MEAILGRINEAKAKEPDCAHRSKFAENWPAFKLDHIKTDEDYLIAMFTSNYHRRQMTKDEKTAVLGGIAEITGWTPKEIAEHLSLSYTTVSTYLSDEYKDPEMRKLRQKREEKKKESPVTSLVTKKEESSPKASCILSKPSPILLGNFLIFPLLSGTSISST